MSGRLPFGQTTFSSLAVPNYRLYFTGQAISLVGTWMQTVAQSWLVLELTGSGTMVGAVAALQALPVLVLGMYGGVVADRVDKRRLMIALQASMGLLALVLGLLVVTGTVQLWHVMALASLLGSAKAFENPARQSFILELVGTRDLRNAVSLNSVLASMARAVGAAAAGAVIGAAGTGVCFLSNSVSFAAVVYTLVRIDATTLVPATLVARARAQLREGVRYAVRTPSIGAPLAMLALVGCLAYETQVVLPVVAKQTFHGDGSTYGYMTAAMGAGALIGGLVVASRGRSGLRPFIWSSFFLGAVIAFAALSPSLPIIMVALALVGAASVSFRTGGNSTLQLAADPAMRGRVMGLMAVAMLGSRPIGGPIVGSVSELAGGRWGLALGALACAVAGVFGLVVARRGRLGAARAECL